MAPKTIKKAIADTLEDLSKSDYEKFCSQLLDRREEPKVKRSKVEDKSFLVVTDVLVNTFNESKALVVTLELLRAIECLEYAERLDRREEPRIRRSAVEDKSILVIADLLVSTFTERKALQVTLDLLRQINCNEEAERLDSKTKVCLDKGDPIFPKTSTGELETELLQEALEYAAVQRPLQAAQYRGPKEVEAGAKALVLSEGGDPHNDRLVLSRFIIQFGKHKGKSFKWLLENDVDWVVYLVGSHLREQEKGIKQEGPLMANKDSLTQYATAFPKVLKEIKSKRGNELVGFGAHELETLQNLYNSKDPDKISYVSYLRTMSSTCEPGSKMEVAVQYVLQRDRMQASASTNWPATPRAASKRPTRHQPITASWPKRRKSKRNQRRANPKSRY